MSDSVSVPPENTGSSPGGVLRRCREFHGITLEEASEATKIGLSYLKALEDDRIYEFANQAYLKGFLRIYAAFLGLNSDDVARMYGKLFGIPDEKPDSSRPLPAVDRNPRRLVVLRKLLFPALLLAAILVTATFYQRAPAPSVRQPQPAAVVAPQPQEAAVQIVQSSVRASAAVKDVPTPRRERRPEELSGPERTVTVKRPAEAARGLILKVRVTQNGTLTSTVDGSAPQQYELSVGDVIEWKAEKKVTLELSNSEGVEVELNGKSYKLPGPPGKPVYVELDADGLKQ